METDTRGNSQNIDEPTHKANLTLTSNSQNMHEPTYRPWMKHRKKRLLPAPPTYEINPPRSLLADTKLMTTREISPMCATIPPKCLPFGLPLEYPWM